jgi:hypothetical protein
MNTLTLNRFNGNEVYQIDKTTLKLTEKSGKPYLNIKITTSAAIETLEDTRELKAKPTVEINLEIPENQKSGSEISHFELENGFDKFSQNYPASLYYMEHQELNSNKIDIRKLPGGKFSIIWTATTRDINNYDGKKPETIVTIDTETGL